MLGGAGSIQNSQCTITWGSAPVSGTGNTLVLNLSIAFGTNFGGNRIVYMAARDVAENNSGWQALGTCTIPFAASGTVGVAGIAPSHSIAAVGAAQNWTFMLTDTKGAGDFGVVNLLANNFIDGRQACYLAYVAPSNSLLLVDDAGDAGGPFTGSMVLNGSAGAIQNGQCSVSGAGSSAVKNGNTLTVTLNISFKAGFAGNRVVWLAGREGYDGNNTGWQEAGTVTVQ